MWPFWANQDFSMATLIEKRTTEDGFDKSGYVIFDKNFKIVAKIRDHFLQVKLTDKFSPNII